MVGRAWIVRWDDTERALNAYVHSVKGRYTKPKVVACQSLRVGRGTLLGRFAVTVGGY